VPAWDAVIGCDVHVPTLEGRAKLKIAPGTPSGKKLRLPGLGLPLAGGKRGDFLAVVSLTIPTSTDPAERALWQQIADSHRR